MEFRLDQFMDTTSSKTNESVVDTPLISNQENPFEWFYLLCEEVKRYIADKQEESPEEWLERQKKAILGYPKEVEYYLNEINFYLDKNQKKHVVFPKWYDQLDEAIFHENWGLAGIYQWVKHGTTSSCKVIQPRIYFLENGRSQIQPQTLSVERFNSLKKALLLNDTTKRENDPYQEIYMIDGTRIEIYNNTKEGVIIFRRYVVDNYTFENLAKLGSIDERSIPLLKEMVGCGFNVNMVGPVRSGKTTFFTAYQTYEDPKLEGVFVETDAEVPLHLIMPLAPIIQMIADDEELDGLLKPLMRSDANYLLMGEARDGRALRLMLMITKKGTKRVKGTFHTGNAEDFPYDIAQEIVNIYGGNVWAYMIQAAKGFQFLFEFKSLPSNEEQKRLKAIHEIRLDLETLQISTNIICAYNFEKDTWTYNSKLSENTIEIGLEENAIAFRNFQKELIKLEEESPLHIKAERISPFSKLIPIVRGG